MDDRDLQRRWHRAPGGIPLTAAETMVPELLDEDYDYEDEDSIRTLAQGGAETKIVAAAEGLVFGELLGEGGAARVFRADQVSLRREVAVKIVRSNTSQRAFVAESRITGGLDHPNILPVHDLVPLGDGSPAMVMKRVVGRTWREHLDTLRAADRLDLVAELRTFVTVCNAVAFAHARGVLHLDLKPANVMVGDFGEVLVTDWGCAAVLDARGQWADQPQLPRAAAIRAPFGTPAYMPPELARGDGASVDVRSDVYLLGGVLYELISGRPPRRGADVEAILADAASGGLPDLPVDVPSRLAELSLACMAREPADRPATVIDLRDAVQHWLDTRESRRIASEAFRRLARIKAEIAGLPVVPTDGEGPGERLLEVIGAFSQARLLWPANEVAAAGESDARRLSAERALRRGEPGLAEAQALYLPIDDPDRQRLIDAAQAVRTDVERARRHARNLRWGLALTATALLVTAAVALVLIEIERVEARDAAEAAAAQVRELQGASD